MWRTQTDATDSAILTVPQETLLNGKTIRRHRVEINGQKFSINKGPLSFASLEEEWFDDLKDPEIAIAGLSQCRPHADIFTFCQRVPETEPKYTYPMRWESLAVLPISTYDHWWTKQVKGTTRNMIRKSQKTGVEVRQATFNDDFLRGMVHSFNESPVRQGRRFWHYGKDFETVKRQFSRFLFREDLIGAYYQSELIGFVMLGNAGRFGVLGQFISKFKHRDKATNNALMAKTVEICEKRQLPYLTYGSWTDSSLVDFKRHCGFWEVKLPHYFVPLTLRGRVASKLGLDRLYADWRAILPKQIKRPLKRLRLQLAGLNKGF